MTSEMVTAAIMNTHVRDNDQYLYDVTPKRIEEVLLTVDTVSIPFSNIPQTYKHLMMAIQARGTDAAIRASMKARFNGDSAGNYAYQFIRNFNGAGAGTTDADNAVHLMDIAGATAAAGRAGMSHCLIPDYAGTTWHKQTSSSGGNFGGVVADWIGSLVLGLWKSTAAITSITLVGPASFKTGSIFTLYGLE